MSTTKHLYNRKYFINSVAFQNDKTRFDGIVRDIMGYSPKRVLDVGCGLGTMVRYLRDSGIDAIGVDFADTLRDYFGMKEDYFVIADANKLPFKDEEFDVVISTDFFEHIPEEEIDNVLNEMKRVGKVIMARIAYQARLSARQMKLHVTNKPEEWWKQKLTGVILI